MAGRPICTALVCKRTNSLHLCRLHHQIGIHVKLIWKVSSNHSYSSMIQDTPFISKWNLCGVQEIRYTLWLSGSAGTRAALSTASTSITSFVRAPASALFVRRFHPVGYIPSVRVPSARHICHRRRWCPLIGTRCGSQNRARCGVSALVPLHPPASRCGR